MKPRKLGSGRRLTEHSRAMGHSARDARRAAASVLVLVLVGIFITGDLTAGELALAHPVSRPGQERTVTVYGRITGEDAPYRVIASHKNRGGRTVVDARTTTAADGTYKLTIKRTRGVERISVIGSTGKETASRTIALRPWVDYRLDGRVRFRLKLWFLPVFGY